MKSYHGTGGEILAQCLAGQGVKRVSTVAGESYLAVLDALLDHQDIDVITCRQEGGAAFMAESWGKLTGKSGVCFVTRGPGATNAAIGIHTANQDSTPMILFVGQVRRIEKGREAFQEIDIARVFGGGRGEGGLAKWATEITDPARIPEIVNRAFQVAQTGRPGPVVIGLPEDMLTEKADTNLYTPDVPVNPGFDTAAFDTIREIISQASKPVLLLGGPGWQEQSCRDIASFASAVHLPVLASLRRQDIFNHRDGNYVGDLGFGPNPALLDKLKESDCWLVIGARLNEICTQNYTLPPAPTPDTKIIHIHPDTAELNKVYNATLAIPCGVNETASFLAGNKTAIDGRGWESWKRELRNLYEDWTAIDATLDRSWNGADMTALFRQLRDILPNDSIITTDAGNFSGWAQRYLYYGRPGRLLAPISGAMGYAVPSAVGASLAAPDKTVVGLCGDGGFMMTGQELATAMHHGAKPVIMVFNNGIYGTIRMHQERDYPGRVSATSLTNPDFVKLADSYGAFTARLSKAEDFPTLWDQAVNAGKLAVIEVTMDPAQITTQAIP